MGIYPINAIKILLVSYYKYSLTKLGINLKFCPLCHTNDSSQASLHEYYKDCKRTYVQCDCCDLVSVPDEFLLSSKEEKSIYDLHENNSDDEGYRKFLARAFTPLKEKVSSDAIGLDFGCGPGPSISKMAEEANIKIEDYDLYYFNYPELLKQKYNFVILTEVIEHIADAASLLQQLDSLLKSKAILVIMTKRVIDKQKFENWHYKNDLTHIRFYSLKTFEWIANKLNWRLEIIDKDVVYFYKNQ